MVRSEFPRPQLFRGEENWINLNGQWEFDYDNGRSGEERGMFTADAEYNLEITVPFCPESELSGIGNTDFIYCVWYRRMCEIPESWDLIKGRVLVHFGAVDYEAKVWVNDRAVGTHRGGYSSFRFDITDALAGSRRFRLTVRAEDDTRSPAQASGKQSPRLKSFGCHYTRTTGIWQTVWLEYVPRYYVRDLFLTPDVKNGRLSVRVRHDRYVAPGTVITARAIDEGEIAAEARCEAKWGETEFYLEITRPKLWEPGNAFLYGLELIVEAPGELTDRIWSYFGMRSVEVTPKCVLINGRPVYQRLVLDQGFNPRGIYTAPTDDFLRQDILRSMALGFNGARLHQRVFEQRFFYWADKLGYLCWGEHANWGYAVENPALFIDYMNEWSEIVERDYSSPSVIGWCPFNETVPADPAIGAIYRLTKRLDPSRPVIDTSGWCHHISADGRTGTDLYDFHDYEQNAEALAQKLRPYSEGVVPPHAPVTDPKAWVKDTPYFCSEFGGTQWAPGREGWGYGTGPKSEEEFVARFGSLVTLMLKDPDMCAFCYTQLTDVEQEVNGLYTYDRELKFPAEVLRRFVAQPAAIEEEYEAAVRED